MHCEFVTKWILDGTTAERVYETLSSRTYGEWQEGVTVYVLEEGDEQGLGEIRESVFTTKLPYKLRFQNQRCTRVRQSIVGNTRTRLISCELSMERHWHLLNLPVLR